MSAKDRATALAVDSVRAGYGDTVVLEGVSIAVAAGGTLAILGRNGVGKSTLLATIMGHTTLHGGSIRFAGQELALSRPIGARGSASATCRRSGKSSSR